MTKTQYYVASSLDGFIADRDGSLDWLMQFGFEEFGADYQAFLADVGVVVMGSATYEFVQRDSPDAWAYPDQISWVLSRRPLAVVPGGDIRFARGSMAELHWEWLRAADGKNIWIVGGGNVAAQAAEANVLDEILLTTMPVVLGSGTPLLPVKRVSPVLEVSRTKAYPSGAVSSVYRTRR